MNTPSQTCPPFPPLLQLKFKGFALPSLPQLLWLPRLPIVEGHHASILSRPFFLLGLKCSELHRLMRE